MQGFTQDFVLGEVREKCVGGGSGGGHRRAVVKMVDWEDVNKFLTLKQQIDCEVIFCMKTSHCSIGRTQ